MTTNKQSTFKIQNERRRKKKMAELTKEDDACFEFQAWFLLQENWRRNDDVIFLFIKITFSLLHIKAAT